MNKILKLAVVLFLTQGGWPGPAQLLGVGACSWGSHGDPSPHPPGSVHCALPTAAVAEAPSWELRLSPGVTDTSP